jgi:hypothetical protein
VALDSAFGRRGTCHSSIHLAASGGCHGREAARTGSRGSSSRRWSWFSRGGRRIRQWASPSDMGLCARGAACMDMLQQHAITGTKSAASAAWRGILHRDARRTSAAAAAAALYRRQGRRPLANAVAIADTPRRTAGRRNRHVQTVTSRGTWPRSVRRQCRSQTTRLHRSALHAGPRPRLGSA